MASISKTTIQAVDTGETFSDSVTISSDDSPRNNLVYVDYTTDKDISGVTVSINDSGVDLIVTISGDHGLDPFNNVIKHIPRGSSTNWDSPQTDDAFSDVNAEQRQVYNWTPDYNDSTVTFTINFTEDSVPDSKQFTQIISPDYDSEIPEFLNRI